MLVLFLVTKDVLSYLAQDNLIEELKVKLAQSDPLLRSGKTAVFELLTREEANKETEKLQNQLSTYREALQDREKQIKEKDETIATLEQESEWPILLRSSFNQQFLSLPLSSLFRKRYSI